MNKKFSGRSDTFYYQKNSAPLILSHKIFLQIFSKSSKHIVRIGIRIHRQQMVNGWRAQHSFNHWFTISRNLKLEGEIQLVQEKDKAILKNVKQQRCGDPKHQGFTPRFPKITQRVNKHAQDGEIFRALVCQILPVS